MSEVLGYPDLSATAAHPVLTRAARAANASTTVASRVASTARIASFARLSAVALASFILAGCPSIGPQRAPPPSVDRADTLSRAGDHAGAARVYEALAAENTGPSRTNLLLRAARSYLQARLADDAARVLSTIEGGLTADQSFERQMLNVEIALARRQGPQAWQQLTAIPEPNAAPTAIRYLGVKIRAAFATGRILDAVRAHTARERWLTTAEQRRTARLELLTELRAAVERGVRIEPRTASDTLSRGWLELAPLAAAAAANPNAAQADIASWRSRYPNHPADEVVRSELLGMAPGQEQPLPTPGEARAARHVALLLPLTGRLANQAITVRDGFLTAYYVSPPDERPRIRIYDTGATSISDALTRATQEGADFIVGPLTRDEVAAASDLPGPRPPVLALNYLPPDRTTPNEFYQFALSPEDEARQAARRVLADGHRRGIALVPDGDWGTRVLTAFQDELIAGGGTLIGSAGFNAAETDYRDPIKQVLRLNDSIARHQRLERVLGTKLQFEPRRRGDVDFIFAASQAETARLLRPQLKFHFAGDIPTYATSDAFEPNPTANQDMDGLMFPDMPWMLGGPLAEGVRNAAREAWPSGGPRRNRLFAFGFDAYRLFAALRNQPGGATIAVDGLTGRLSVNADRHIRRDLEWARLQGGQPRILPQAFQQP